MPWSKLPQDVHGHVLRYLTHVPCTSLRDTTGALAWVTRHVKRWTWPQTCFVYACRRLVHLDKSIVARLARRLQVRRRARGRTGRLSWRPAISRRMRKSCRGCGRRTTACVFGTRLCGACTSNPRMKYAYMIHKTQAFALVPRARVVQHCDFRCTVTGAHETFYDDIVALSQGNTVQDHAHHARCRCYPVLSGSWDERRRRVFCRLDMLHTTSHT